MPPDDDIRAEDSTFNELRNDDKQLLLANGYKPGELDPEDERELIRDLREQNGMDDGDDDAVAESEIGDSIDGADADAG